MKYDITASGLLRNCYRGYYYPTMIRQQKDYLSKRRLWKKVKKGEKLKKRKKFNRKEGNKRGKIPNRTETNGNLKNRKVLLRENVRGVPPMSHPIHSISCSGGLVGLDPLLGLASGGGAVGVGATGPPSDLPQEGNWDQRPGTNEQGNPLWTDKHTENTTSLASYFVRGWGGRRNRVR